MKPKTIAKTINAKMNAWTDTLPEDIKKAIQNKIVVTGGSIASMFLKEPVNDYDLYFKDIKSVILVTQHYCKEWIKTNSELPSGVSKGIVPMIRLSFSTPDEMKLSEGEFTFPKSVSYFTHEDTRKMAHKGQVVVHPDDEGISAILESKSDWGDVLRAEIFIQSAGVVGNNPDSDEDYQYFEGEEPQRAGEFLENQMQEEKVYDNRDKGEYKIVFMSANAITLSDKVQVVIRFFGEPSEIHDTYDFIHATNYWTRKGGLNTNTRALEALLSRELIYTGSKYPLASIFRTRKFIIRDWKCHVGNYVKMAMQLNEMDLCDPEVLEEQLTGVDAAYLHEIIRAVKDKRKDDKDFVFNSAYICELADRLMGEDSMNEKEEE